MPRVEVKNLKNESVGELELNESVFGAQLNQALIYDAVKNYQANQRQGTVGTKTRGDTRGSGKKLWRQKGTGRARIASLRSPLWKGGGNVHGPQPRDWSYELPKKMKRGALKAALSERLREGNLIVVEDFNLDAVEVKAANGEALANHKTKKFLSVAASFGWQGKTLIVENDPGAALVLSSRNVPGVAITSGALLNIYDVLYHDRIVFSRSAIGAIEERLGK
ncbi:MAG: 50S ribosomal protein L4 [Acidobacteria bacterium]|nr:50S ribosomal protein L4 [Acidobacteriota bacterium]MCW5968396.1 50S ribosomal protein L4 [Blastocatellales bacterium]